MYFFAGILIIILLFAIIFGFCRRRMAIKSVRSMSCEEKCCLLNELLQPFGYCYDNRWDAVSTRNDAWQRGAGYTAVFDRAALHFHMVFDALPIYFHYGNRTWLIELWKGQYGINTGAEVGIYYADGILSEEYLPTAHFQAVSDEDRLPVSFTLYRRGSAIARMQREAWWLTVFFVGMLSKPSQLVMDVAIRFPAPDMQQAFLTALKKTGLSRKNFHCHDTEVHIRYEEGCPLSPVCPEKLSFFRRIQLCWAGFCNRLSVRLYCFVTRPFSCTLDKILYLYKLLPFVLRRTLRRLKGVLRR